MLKVNDVDLDFDITSPIDLKRYKDAGEKMEQAAENMPPFTVEPDDPDFVDLLIESLNLELKIFGDFVDEVFGDGVANKLLGSNPSLNKIADVNEALEKALEKQGTDFGVRLGKYTPNRATRRGKK